MSLHGPWSMANSLSGLRGTKEVELFSFEGFPRWFCKHWQTLL
jgi:hypothetical protein